jgi:hypothetical protein
MAIPFLGQHDAAQARMSVEAHAEQVPHFALVEIGRRPNRDDAVNGRVDARDHRLQPDALLQLVGKDVVRDLEARLPRIPVDAGDVFEEVVSGALESATDAANGIGGDNQGQLAVIEFGVGDGVGMGGAKGLDGHILREACVNSLFIEQRFSHVISQSSQWLLQIRLVGGPVENAFFPNVEDAEDDESQVDDHFPETEEAGARNLRELPVDHGPGKHENRFYIEEDEQHRDHIEAHGEAPAGIAFSGDAALVGFQFFPEVAMAADEPRHGHHAAG